MGKEGEGGAACGSAAAGASCFGEVSESGVSWEAWELDKVEASVVRASCFGEEEE